MPNESDCQDPRAPGADLRGWRECPDCGLFQELPLMPDGSAAHCGRCDARLGCRSRDSIATTLACAAGAGALLAFAVTLPMLDVRLFGRFSRATVFTGPAVLEERGAGLLSVVVVITLLVMPAIKLGLTIVPLVGIRVASPPRWLPWLFAFRMRVAPWAMVDVFLLGVAVAYSRLRAWAQVDIGPSLIALAGLAVSMMAADVALDDDAVWSALTRHIPERLRDADASPSAVPVGCEHCGRVSLLDKARSSPAPCPRCAHHLRRRKPRSVARAWALTLAAAILYIPANVLPVMTVRRFGRGEPDTILSGVVELAGANLWPLAVLVFLASIVVPMLKLVGLAAILVTTHRRSANRLRVRTRLFRFIVGIGRWSMIDIFALTTLVAAVRMGLIALVLPGAGAVAFCAVVSLTMFAAELFDPRLMWDAAGADSGAAHILDRLRQGAPPRPPVRTASRPAEPRPA